MADTTRAALGFQDALRITATPPGATARALIGKVLTGQQLTVAGDYQCDIDTAGLAKVEAHLTASAVTGSVTPKFEALYADGGSKQVAAGAAAFVAGTQQDLTITLDPGVKKCRVTITVAAGASCTMGRAEANGL